MIRDYVVVAIVICLLLAVASQTVVPRVTERLQHILVTAAEAK